MKMTRCQSDAILERRRLITITSNFSASEKIYAPGDIDYCSPGNAPVNWRLSDVQATWSRAGGRSTAGAFSDVTVNSVAAWWMDSNQCHLHDRPL